jgi:hypothetical protein
MNIDSNTKDIQKNYCRTILASEGKLTKELFDKINSGDEAAIREVLKYQKQKIIDSANKITDEVNRDLTLTQADSIQEVLDCLDQILNA